MHGASKERDDPPFQHHGWDLDANKGTFHPTRGSIGRLPSKLKAHICNEKCVRTQKEIQNVMACQFSCMNILLFIRVYIYLINRRCLKSSFEWSPSFSLARFRYLSQLAAKEIGSSCATCSHPLELFQDALSIRIRSRFMPLQLDLRIHVGCSSPPENHNTFSTSNRGNQPSLALSDRGI